MPFLRAARIRRIPEGVNAEEDIREPEPVIAPEEVSADSEDIRALEDAFDVDDVTEIQEEEEGEPEGQEVEASEEPETAPEPEEIAEPEIAPEPEPEETVEPEPVPEPEASEPEETAEPETEPETAEALEPEIEPEPDIAEEPQQEETPEPEIEPETEPLEPEPEQPKPQKDYSGATLNYDFTSGERYVDTVSTKTEFDKMLDELSAISGDLLSHEVEKFAVKFTGKFQGGNDKAEADAKKYEAFLGGYITNAAMLLYDNGYKDAAIKRLDQAKSILEARKKLEDETEAIKARVEEQDDSVDLSDILGLFGD